MEGTNEAAEPAVVGRACLPMERTDEPTVYTSSSPGIEELVWKARRLASERRRDMERRFEDVVEDQLDNVFPDFIPKRDTEHDAPGGVIYPLEERLLRLAQQAGLVLTWYP